MLYCCARCLWKKKPGFSPGFFVFGRISTYSLINSDEFDENIYKNSFEKEVADAFRTIGHNVVCGIDIAGLSADLLIDDKYVVECDGVEDKNISKITNMKKKAIIERSGLKVSRITYREWQYSPKACLDRVINCNL